MEISRNAEEGRFAELSGNGHLLSVSGHAERIQISEKDAREK